MMGEVASAAVQRLTKHRNPSDCVRDWVLRSSEKMFTTELRFVAISNAVERKYNGKADKCLASNDAQSGSVTC